jgi:hypothetical protein
LLSWSSVLFKKRTKNISPAGASTGWNLRYNFPRSGTTGPGAGPRKTNQLLSLDDLFFLKKEPKTLALRELQLVGFCIIIFLEAELRGLGLAPEKQINSCRWMICSF